MLRRTIRVTLRIFVPLMFAFLIFAEGAPQSSAPGTPQRTPARLRSLLQHVMPGTTDLQLIVELADPSVVQMMSSPAGGGGAAAAAAGQAPRRIRLDSQQALTYRTQLARTQSLTRNRLAAVPGVEVQGSTSVVMNSVVVRVPAEQYEAVRSMPGVKKVYFSRARRMRMDAAANLLRAPDLWARVSGGRPNAGQGIKIGVIDTGIDITNPMFQDTTTAIPAGFPLFGPPEHSANQSLTNHKVIVARDYLRFLSPQRTQTAEDEVGHGTFVAGCAAGKVVSAPLAQVSGMAPGAFLGSYKVFGTPGVNDQTSDAAIIAAIEDAVSDGMDVLNLSLGSLDYIPPAEDAEAVAVANATRAGVVVAMAAGNDGPDTHTLDNPGSASEGIAVGGTWNARVFAAQLRVTGPGTVPAFLQSLPYVIGTGPSITAAVPSSPVTDVAALDGSGLGCAAYPARSLDGRIALMQRGTCFFVDKVSHAADAGARAVIVYDNVAGEAPVTMGGLDGTAIPAVMMYKADGIALKNFVGANPAATVSVEVSSSNRVATNTTPVLALSSSRGPAADFGVKPDLVAPGWSIYSAAQTRNSSGFLYDPSGFAVSQGTSFSTAIVSGAAAAVKGLFSRISPAPEAIRSLLANTASPVTTDGVNPASIVQAGGGMVDLANAAVAVAVFAPTSLNFGVQSYSGTVSLSRTLRVTNISDQADQFSLSAQPVIAGPAISFSPQSTGSLAPGASADIAVTVQAVAPMTGGFQGFIAVQSSRTSTSYSVPYWAGIYVSDPSRVLTVSQSSTSPGVFRNLTDALAAANPGNVIEFADSGTYSVPLPPGGASWGFSISTNAEGLPLHGITIRAAEGQTPVLDGTATDAVSNLQIVGVRNVLIQGLTINGGDTGIYILQPSASVPLSVTVDRCTLTNQTASTQSTGIWVDGAADVSITHSTISGSSGSGLFAQGGTRLLISDSTVQGNSTDGIEAFDCNVDLIDSTVTGNFGVGANLDSCSGTLTGNTFSNNRSFFNGDGVEIWGGSLTLKGNTFSGNESAGIFVSSSFSSDPGPEVRFEGNRIVSNSGYGIQVAQARSLQVAGNWIADNGVGFVSGGTTTATLANNIIVRSQTAGGGTGNGIEAGGSSSVRVVNCTIYKNQAAGIRATGGGSVSAQNIVVSANTGGDLAGLAAGSVRNSFVGDGSAAGNGNLSGNPLLRNPDADDFSLAAGSPAIDSGANSAAGLPFLDYSGRLRAVSSGARPGEGTVDMGALESGSFYPLNFPLLVSGPNLPFGGDFITGIAMLNPTSSADQASLTAYDTSGALVQGNSNPTIPPLALNPQSQVPILDYQLFTFPRGASRLGAALAASVEKLVGFFLLFDQGFSHLADGVAISGDAWTDFYLPRHRFDPEEQAVYQIFNPGVNAANVTASLLDGGGSQPEAPKTFTIPPKGQHLFAFDGVQSAGGYVHVASDRPVTGVELFGNGTELSALGAVPAGTEARLYFPHVVANEGYASLLGVVNSGSQPATLTLTFYGNDGAILGSPAERGVSAAGQLLESAASLFQLGTGSQFAGYVVVDSDAPGILGFSAVGYSEGGVQAKAAVPGQSVPQSALLFSQIAHLTPSGTGENYLTGIALLNPYGTAISYTVKVFNGDGQQVAEMSDTLGPHAKVAKYLSHPSAGAGFFSQPIQLSNGHIEVTTDHQILGFEMFFTESQSQFVTVMAQSAR